LTHKQKDLNAAMGRARELSGKEEEWYGASPAKIINDLLDMIQQRPQAAFSQQHHGEQEWTEDHYEEEDSHMERQGLEGGAAREERKMPTQKVQKQATRMMSTTDKF
jgi:hypothetical protein